MSTSILAFHKLAADADGRPAIVLERHGSLDIEPVRALWSTTGSLSLLARARSSAFPPATSRSPSRSNRFQQPLTIALLSLG